MSMSKLEASLSQKLEPIYLVVGDAGPLVEEAVALLVAKGLESAGLPAFNHSSFRASEANGAEAFSAARTLPMMADLRVVVVRDLGQGSNEFFTSFLAYIEEASTSSLVVVTGDRFPKVEKGGRNWSVKVKNALKKHKTGQIFTFGSRDVRPASYAQDRARALGKQLGRREAELLVEIVGGDLGQIRTEVDKVALFVGDAAQISSEAISAACSVLAEAVIWDLTASLAARDVDPALGALHRLQEGGDDPRKLLGMIVWQYRQLLKMSEMARLGAPDQAIRQTARMRPDVFRKIRPRLDTDFPSPSRAMSRLAAANRDMNSHRGGAQRILEELVLEMLGEGIQPRTYRPPLR